MSQKNSGSVKPSGRIAAIDQMRGYAVFGMFLVNYFENFDATFNQLHHHKETFSFADTIAPLFMFVVGMGMRLSILRRAEQVGIGEARKGLFGRYLILACVGFAIYQGWVWDALTSIATAGLLALVVVDKKPAIRIAWGLLFVSLFQYMMLYTDYGAWMMGPNPWGDEKFPLWIKIIPLYEALFACNINGGLLGHWSWMLMLIAGTLGYDLFMTRDSKKIITWGLAAAAGCIAIAWILKVEWPGMKAEWVFSKRYTTAPYAFLATGTSFIALVVFYVLCDIKNLRLPTMSVLGLNAFILYIMQSLFFESVSQFFPEETTNMVGVVLGFCVFFGVLYGVARYMYDRKIIVKL